MRILLTCLLFALCLATSLAQKSTTRLVSKGAIPSDFLETFSDKYNADKQKLGEVKKNRKARKEFFLESNYLLRQMLLGGKVMYGDPLSNYANKVLDKLLKDKPDLRKKLRVYTLKSSAMNAFATDQGMIFITVGLMAKMENEAQLAFILGHEVGHFTKSHSMLRYVENKKIDKDIRQRSGTNLSLLAKAKYSQENEFVADEEGVTYILSSEYNPLECATALSLLRDPSPLWGDQKFEFSWIESGKIKLPTDYWLDSLVQPPHTHDNKLYSSHPAIDDRIEKVNKLIGDKKDGKKFLSSADEFNDIVVAARKEVCQLLLDERQFFFAIQANESEARTDKALAKFHRGLIGKAMCAIAIYKAARRFDRIAADYDKYSKSMQRIIYAYDKMRTEEIVTLAISYNANLNGQNDKYLQHTIAQIGMNWNMPYENIDTGKEDSVLNYLAGVYSDVRSNGTYKKWLETKYVEDTIEIKMSKKTTGGGKIGKLLVVDPFYVKLDMRKSNPTKFIASEKTLIGYNSLIAESGQRVGMEMEILSPYYLKAEDEQKFRDLAVLKNYLDQTYWNSQHGVELLPFDDEPIQALKKRYGTEFISVIGGASVHVKKGADAYTVLIITIVVYPTLPFGLWYLIKPQYEAINVVSVYDIDKHKRIYDDYHYMKMKDSKASLSTSVYYNMLKLKSIEK